MLFYSKFLVIIAPIRLMTLITQLTLMPILVGIHNRASEKYKMVCKTGLSEAKLPEIV